MVLAASCISMFSSFPASLLLSKKRQLKSRCTLRENKQNILANMATVEVRNALKFTRICKSLG